MSTTRRNFLKTAGFALILLPLVIRQASAITNSAVRVELKYQGTPKDNMSCAACLEFIPGSSERNSGKCNVIPDDDEISPNGYCTQWH